MQGGQSLNRTEFLSMKKIIPRELQNPSGHGMGNVMVIAESW